MSIFGLFRTWLNPTQGSNAQRGFPAPGTGRQSVGVGLPYPPAFPAGYTSGYPTQGTPAFIYPTASSNAQRGFPAPLAGPQQRPRGSIGAGAPVFGGVIYSHTRTFSRGAGRYGPVFGTLYSNPIGAGIVARYGTKASYGPSGQYINHTIFWASQTIPTSLRLGPLTTPEMMKALLGNINVQAAVRSA